MLICRSSVQLALKPSEWGEDEHQGWTFVKVEGDSEDTRDYPVPIERGIETGPNWGVAILVNLWFSFKVYHNYCL